MHETLALNIPREHSRLPLSNDCITGLAPIVARELRAQSRRRVTWWLRVISLAPIFLLLYPMAAHLDRLAELHFGGRLLARLNAIIFTSIWILVPLAVIASTSQDRREGPLRLSPLKGGSIIIATGLAHGLRCSSLLFSTIPVMALPMLLGGITFLHVAWVLVINTAALLYALLAGFIASIVCTRWSSALLLAPFLSLLASNLFVRLNFLLSSAAGAPVFFNARDLGAVAPAALRAQLACASAMLLSAVAAGCVFSILTGRLLHRNVG